MRIEALSGVTDLSFSEKFNQWLDQKAKAANSCDPIFVDTHLCSWQEVGIVEHVSDPLLVIKPN